MYMPQAVTVVPCAGTQTSGLCGVRCLTRGNKIKFQRLYILLIIQMLSSFLFYDVLDIKGEMYTVYLDWCLVLAFNLGKVLDIRD